ncbi:FG-GAP repeat domain-containing protein [Plantactinospora sp. GCM10030261]|uniref:FG-GAP repeat domain-containing protein n=1 Tax=Plantactinospora sp. GCM10030261 TaxID=3273420 RepID=UPI00360635A2
MWRHRITLTAAAVVAVLATAPAAWAGRPGEAIYGDINGDRRTDRVTLGGGTTHGCAVDVALGHPAGGYGKPTSHAYPVPGVPDAYCPDLGVLVDLGGDGTVELVLAWFDGAPPGHAGDLLALRDFAPVGGFRAVFQPSYLGAADFDGDGRLDLYEWTDQGEGFVTLLNTADGKLVPGPLRWCSPHYAPDVRLADFEADGDTELLVSYQEACADAASGVSVLRGDGSRIDLERDVTATNQWSVQVLDANGDGRPDVRTTDGAGTVHHHLSRRDGGFDLGPRGQPGATGRPRTGVPTARW